jgi:hypothetical protein
LVKMAATPELIGESDLGRALYLSAIAELGEWPARVSKPEPYFVLFLALDASELASEVVRAFADKIGRRELVTSARGDRIAVAFTTSSTSPSMLTTRSCGARRMRTTPPS